MQGSNRVIVAAIGGLALALAVTVRAQQPTPPAQPPPPQAPPATQTPPPRPPGAVETPPTGEHGGQATTPAPPPGPGGPGSRQSQARFPAHQRPPADPAVVARGKAVFAGSCGACHGADGRGGQLGGANLLRSQLVLNDKDGELIGPVVLNGRPGTLMPPIPVAPEDLKAIAAFLHDLQSKGSNQGGPPPGEEVPLNVLVGDAKAGQQYFAKTCGTCHSPSGDLQGIGTRIPDARVLQNIWVSGGSARMRGPGAPTAAKPPAVPMATITLPSGETASGRLVRLDDFSVTIAQEDGAQRSFRRKGDVPKVDVKDPLQAHRELLPVYTDKNMHDVTAYLASLK